MTVSTRFTATGGTRARHKGGASRVREAREAGVGNKRFKAAFALSATYDIAGNLGDVELTLEKSRDAAEHLAFSLRHWPAGQAEARAKTQARFDQAKKLVAWVTVSVNVEGADVLVNGQPVGKSPLEGEVFVAPGAITIEAKLDGKTDKSTVALDKGESRAIQLEVTEGGGGSGEPNGNGGGGVDGGSTVHKAPLFPAFIGGGVAVLGLAGGLIFLSKASSAQDDADSIANGLPSGNPCGGPSAPSACADLKSANDDVDRNKNLATIGFVTLGVGAAFTAGYLIWRETSATKTQPAAWRAAPSVDIGQRRLSVSIVGNF